MENKKMNWGTLILGVIIGAVVVGVIWAASKPAATGAQFASVCQQEISEYVECVQENQGPTSPPTDSPTSCNAAHLIEACANRQ